MIGDSKKVVDGNQQYVIRYKVRNGLRFFEDYDELYWNAIGNGWDTGIYNSSVDVNLFTDIVWKKDDLTCFTGRTGSKEQNCLSSISGARKISFRGSEKLKLHEGFTIAVKLPKGLIVAPDKVDKFIYFLLTQWGYFLPIIVFVSMYFIWLKKGKELSANHPVVTEFSPPENLTPGQLDYLMKERYNLKSLTADIVNLAVKGFIKIKVTKSKKILNLTAPVSIFFVIIVCFFFISNFINLHKKGMSFSSLSIYSVPYLVFMVIFFFPVMKKIKKPFKRDRSFNYELIKVDKVKKNNLVDYEKVILEDIFNEAESCKNPSIKVRDIKNLPSILSSAKQAIKKDIFQKKYFDDELVHKKWTYIFFAVLLFVAVVVSASVMGRDDIFFGGISSSIIIVVISFVMSRKTRAGLEVFLKGKGFEEYIKVSYKYRARFYEKQRIFEDFLPYAMIFSLTDEWVKGFKGIYNRHCSWYIAENSSQFTRMSSLGYLHYFSNDFYRDLSLSNYTHSSSGSSSGFSGGSSGGGGGGSW